MKLLNQAQWVKETQKARGTLTAKYGFADDLFVTVADDMTIHMRHHDDYPAEWESTPDMPKVVKVKEMIKRDCIPSGLVLFMMPESQCNCFNCAGDDVITAIYKDPIMMLESIEDWERKHKSIG